MARSGVFSLMASPGTSQLPPGDALHNGRSVQGMGQQPRRFQFAEFLSLGQPGIFPEAVTDDNAGRHGRVARQHVGHVGDGVVRPGG